MGLTPHPHLVCRGPRKSRAIPLLNLRAFVAYKKGETYLPMSLILISFNGNLQLPKDLTDALTIKNIS